jgi:hypothetical protein
MICHDCAVQSREPHWSPDGFWWWDGEKWVPAAQAPMPPPPSMPPGYFQMPPPMEIKPSPGLRTFLIVVLAIDAFLFGLLTVFGTLGEGQNISEGKGDVGGVIFWFVFAIPFALAVAGLVAVIRHTSWARWVALAAGVAATLTCLGSVIGIPIIVAAARAPLRQAAST